MSKTTKIIMTVFIVVAVIAVIAVIAVVGMNSGNGKTNLPQVASNEDLVDLVDKVYENSTVELYDTITSMPIDLTDETSVKSFTGLEDGSNFELLSVSEPMINAIPYSLVIGKVKEGINANELAKEMSESIDQRKWICVSAEKVLATNSGNIVF